MYPDIFKTGVAIPGFGPIELPAYFTAVVIGFAAAIILVRRWSGKAGVDPDGILDLGILMVVSGVLGARVLSVIADGHFWDYFHLCTDPMEVDWPIDKASCMSDRFDGIWDPVERVCHPDYRDCFSWLKFWKGGLAFYGGFLLAAAAGLLFLKARKMPLLKVVDAAGWAIPLGLGWGRIGCIFNGCCYGAVTGSWFRFVFPPRSQASLGQFREGLLEAPDLPSLPVVPTQWIEAAGAFLISVVCYQFVDRRKRFNGQTFIFFVVLYAALRFIEEVWRRDDRGALAGLSTSQIVAIFTAVCALALYFCAAARNSARKSSG